MNTRYNRRWKYCLAVVLIACQIVAGAFAAPALSGVFTVQQPDGTLLSVEQLGNEYHHWTVTSDGVLVVNRGGAYYVAAIDDAGELSSTGHLVHALPLRDSSEWQLINRQSARLSLFHQQHNSVMTRSMGISESDRYLPHKGSPRVLTILVAFQDSTFTVNDPVNAFEQYLNGETQKNLGNKNHYNQTSVRQYFDICSQGQFTPQFDLVGPVTLPKKLAYYGETNQFSTFCRDAVTQAKGLVPDWSVYDNDGDGIVEMVCIIYAGYGKNQGGGEETIWAKASYQNLKIDDGLSITFFNCSPEHFYPASNIDAEGIAMKDYINGTGVFIHEMSHCMGLPDLYQTVGAYTNNQGMESWDIMDYGLYTRNGFAPTSYTAWEKEVMGWIKIEPITASQHISSLLPLEDGGTAFKFVNTSNNSGNDYIVMESVMKRGLNSYAYGSGLLVYHVAYPRSSVKMSDNPNNTIGRPSVALVPASGTLINSYLIGSGKQYTQAQWKASMAGSVFPGTSNVTALTDDMKLPNYLFYDGSDATMSVGFGLFDIMESSDGISFDIRVSGPDGIQMPIMPVAPADNSYTLQGVRVSSPKKGSIYIHNKRLVICR